MNRALFEGAAFTSIPAPSALRWGALPDFSALLPLTALPIADTELLHLSHYGVIAVHIPADPMALPLVVLLTHPEMSRAVPINGSGKWLPPYMPLALRALPFTPGYSGECLYSPSLVVTAGQASWRAEAAPGKPTAEFRAVLDLVQRIYGGARRLADAARLLLAADVLVPIEPLDPESEARFLVVQEERMAALSPARAAALTALGMLPMELAAASLFSRRYLSRKIDTSIVRSEAVMRYSEFGNASAIEPLPTELSGDNFALDTSTLFNIDDFFAPTRPDE
ncbi:MAG: SapC family protein [Proteobacteria bacterium]|nr:SapC family protein [Pseudomonadota bacterium]